MKRIILLLLASFMSLSFATETPKPENIPTDPTATTPGIDTTGTGNKVIITTPLIVPTTSVDTVNTGTVTTTKPNPASVAPTTTTPTPPGGYVPTNKPY